MGLHMARGYIRPRKRLDGDTELIRAHRELKLDIDAETCVPEWEGEAMDIDMALDGLLAADGVLEVRPGGGFDGGT